MVTCPKCKAENRPEAAFCSRCGTILFVQPPPTIPAEQPAERWPTEILTPPIAAQVPVEQEIIQALQPEATETTPVPVGLHRQAEGTIFGDRFQYNGLLSENEHKICYTVTGLNQSEYPGVRICSNPECRTIHCPVGTEAEKFCTQCGHPLEQSTLLFLLEETDIDRFSYIKHVQELNLVHPNIYPPVATFQQEMPAGLRYYMVAPYSADLPAQPEVLDVLEWGMQLARALDYLQSKGVFLGDELDNSSIGLSDGKAIWRSFSTARILPILTDREKINNIRLLCLAMYTLLTGRPTYRMDPYLPPALNEIFEKAMVGEGFTSGTDLAQQLELVKASGADRAILDYQVGRRSHSGHVRLLNEDSLISLELTTVNKASIFPRGIFAIADGMGGHAAGDLASGMVINTIAQKAVCDIMPVHEASDEKWIEWLKKTVEAANLAVYEARQKAANDMGSTLVVCLLVGAQAYLAYQGDSRIYLINQRGIKQLTTDHSLVQHMVTTGQINQDEARNHPQRNVIYRSLGDKPCIELDCLTQQVFPSDRLLLCSDGLSNQLDDEQLHKIVLEASSPQAACDQLIEAANSAGGEDNISALVVEIITV
jgi:serine/threonine protein phosphatase PrpC